MDPKVDDYIHKGRTQFTCEQSTLARVFLVGFGKYFLMALYGFIMLYNVLLYVAYIALYSKHF